MSTWNRALAVVALCGAVGAHPASARAGGGHGHHGHHGGHHGGTDVVIGINAGYGYWWGPGYFGPRYAWYGYPYPYAYPYPYYYPQPVVVTPPPVEQPVYVERGAAPAPAAPSYWYYCDSEGAYYPDVQTCPEPWVRVPPRAE